MSTRDIIDQIANKELDQMKQGVNDVLLTKANEHMDELKAGIASSYFAQNDDSDEE